MDDKATNEKIFLQGQIQELNISIENEIKAQWELTARLKHLEDGENQQRELEELFAKTYGDKLGQFEKMFDKIKLLKSKLETAK